MPNKKELKALVAKVKRLQSSMNEDESSSQILSQYVREAEKSLSDTRGQKISSSQIEIYHKLEAAVGP
ncbi:MAG: hypothetical protein WCI00_02330 [bacterium]